MLKIIEWRKHGALNSEDCTAMSNWGKLSGQEAWFEVGSNDARDNAILFLSLAPSGRLSSPLQPFVELKTPYSIINFILIQISIMSKTENRALVTVSHAFETE